MDRCDLEIPLKISVVIPAYNAEKYLKEALDSVLAQALPAHEIIVVDDGSTDSTADICKGYSNQILYIKQDNMGLSGARNTGITAATGEWIALLDADDIMLPNRLEVQAGIAAHHADLIVVYSAFTYLYPDGKQSFAQAFPAKDLWPALRYRTPILPSTTMIRRSALLEVGLFRNRIVEDWDLWFRLIKRYTSRAFQEATESLVLYRKLDTSLSANYLKLAKGTFHILDELLLSDLTGIRKYLWKRKIQARFYYHAAVSMRAAGNPRYWEYAIESSLKWPLPGKIVQNVRYKIFAHMLYMRMRNPKPGFRHWWPKRDCVNIEAANAGK